MMKVARIWRGRVGVATDRGGRHAGQDADADAGADDAERREARSDEFHVCCSSCLPGDAGTVWAVVSERALSAPAASGAMVPSGEVLGGACVRVGVLLLVVALDRDDREHEGQDARRSAPA